MFTETKHELGVLQVGKEVKVKYPYQDIKVITRMESPCDCSVPTDYRSEKYVEIAYTPKPVPQHLLLEGKTSYLTEKNILVEYMDADEISRTETLTFTATIRG